jgi:hypothetical protein
VVKVLIFGRAIPKQPDRSTGQQLQQGFIQAGHTAIFCGNFYGEPFRWLGIEEATTQEFDLIIISEHNDGCPGYQKYLEYKNLKNTPILYQDYDVSYHPAVSYQRAASYSPDGYLVGNKYYCGKDAFGRFGKPVLHLPYACSPQIHRKMPDVQKVYHLGFVGSMTEERKRLIKLAQSNVARYGSVHAADGVFGDDLIRQTNEYYVMFHNNQDACKGLVPGRPWETAGCGTTLLMDRTSYEDFVEFLPEHLHDSVFVYNNDTDILTWLNHYAMWQDRTGSLSMAGDALMNYVHANHSYKNRAERIIEWTKEQSLLTQP